MIFELQGANGVGNAFQRIGLTMGKIIAGVYAPLVTGLVMMRMTNAIQNRITQVHIRRSHVDLGPQHLGAVSKLASGHARKEVEIFVNATVAERAVAARLGQVATVLPSLLGGQIADVSLA